MKRKLHSVKIVTKNGSTNVYLDGEEVKGCFQAEVKWAVNELPTVDLCLIATDIEVDIDEADVIKWQEVKVHE